MGTVKFDDLLKTIGSFGPYQVFLFLVLAIAAFTGNEAIFMNFVGYSQPHWCRVHQLDHFTFDHQKYVLSPREEVSGSNQVRYSKCYRFDLNFSSYTQEELVRWNRTARIRNDTGSVQCDDGWVYDQSIITTSIVNRWNLVCGSAWRVSLVSTIFLSGFLFGSLILGLVSDTLGRKPGLFIFLIIKISAGFVSAYAPNYVVLVVARFILAVGSLGTYVTIFTLLMEVVGKGYRTVCGFGYSIVYSIGFMLVPAFSYFTRDDVNLQVIMAAMPCLLLPCMLIIPESPRWLLVKGRHGDAEVVIRKIAAVNGRHLPDDFDIYATDLEVDAGPRSTILDAFRSAELRKRALILCLHWFTDSLIFYALSLNTAELSGDIFLNTLLAGAVEIPANMVGVMAANWAYLGRRLTAVISLLIAGLASLVAVPLILTSASPSSVTGMMLLGKAAATIGFSCMYVYTSELFPTEVRNVGLGSCSFCSRISGMAAPYVGGPLADVWAPLPSLIFGVLALFAGGASLLLPETRGTNLPATIEEVDRISRKHRNKDKPRSSTFDSLQSIPSGSPDEPPANVYHNDVFDERF